MKKLILVRHAKSSWADHRLADRDRPLNQRGLRDAPFIANILRKQGIAPDLMLASPALRTVTTAKLMAAELSYSADRIRTESKIYEANLDTMFGIVESLDDSLQTVMLFGHNPTFTYFAYVLGATEVQHLPTCGTVIMEIDTPHWAALQQANRRVVGVEYPKKYFPADAED